MVLPVEAYIEATFKARCPQHCRRAASSPCSTIAVREMLHLHSAGASRFTDSQFECSLKLESDTKGGERTFAPSQADSVTARLAALPFSYPPRSPSTLDRS